MVGLRRLVDTRTLNLVEFGENDSIPPYAILSHRWIEEKEVTFHEFLNARGPDRDEMKKKSGYQKILKACLKAQNDNIDFIWVDTCCIDKADHGQVAQDVKSMFAYYENSVVCYAYLVDVYRWDYGPDSPHYREQWRKWMFEDSEWFQRGWTLQELLAPKQVVFFGHDWKKIGTRAELKEIISSVTAIPPDLLEGKILVRDVDVRTRMSWAMGRSTTKPPDRAYCLLGILEVSLEPDYDEDVESAFGRLRNALEGTHPESLKVLADGGDLLSLLLHRNVNERMKTKPRVPKPSGNSQSDHYRYYGMCNLYASYTFVKRSMQDRYM